jgi:uncharacterized short protein YbdD (DUF466 family)
VKTEQLTQWWASTWSLVRELATDDAYDKYLEHHTKDHPDQAPMSRRDFYLKQQQGKWTGVKRCC